jgi:4-diphosphocytidyl-2-C-methyl-D-erythritol kinase
VAESAGGLVERAPAKLNLDLLVLGRRPDGYHELDGLVVFAGLGDRLLLAPADSLHLEVTGPFAAGLPASADNLVLRAAGRLAAAAGVTRGARLVLEKNLPVASGIGGGSADAAAALRGLDRLWGLGLGEARLRELGLALGADVPVCAYGRPARLRGIGERLDPVRGLPELPLVLANPGRPVPTGRVFAALDPAAERPARTQGLPAHPSLPQLVAWLAGSRNDLEPAALALEPAVGEALDALRAEPDCWLARMSGSGATCFGLFPTRAAAEAAAGRLRAARPGWWVAATLAGGDGAA